MKRYIKVVSALCAMLLVLLCMASCSFLEFLWPDDEPSILPPDYPPMETDSNQEEIEGAETLAPSTSGGSITIIFDTNVYIDLSEKKISFEYENNYSNQNVVLKLVVGETLLAESAVINPGNKITTMTLRDDAAERLQAGGYNGVIVVGLYDPETNEKSMLDARLEVDVHVQE